MELLIYAHPINPRKTYIFSFIFETILGIPFSFSEDKEVFIASNQPKISYGNAPLAEEMFFPSSAILEERDIQLQTFAFAAYQNYQVPFACSGALFPFDIFAAAFYLLSRYEEYTNKERDEHGRFSAKSSLAFQNGFLQNPVIDEWAFALLKVLKQYFPALKNKQRTYKFIPTLDIDNPYYLKTEKPLRRILKTVKMLINGKFSVFFKDPFDVYQQVTAWDKIYQTQTIYFILVGNQSSYDAVFEVNHPKFKKMLLSLKKQHQIGIHPSCRSNDQAQDLPKEKSFLESLLKDKVNISRQHYLKMNLPETYQELIKSQITHDYSLAYADEVGFRAATCTPFLWYDLKEEKSSNLWVHPTAVMDQTLKKYRQLHADEALAVLALLIKNVKAVNGELVTLWHNESVNDFGAWKGWKRVYQQMLEMAAAKK